MIFYGVHGMHPKVCTPRYAPHAKRLRRRYNTLHKMSHSVTKYPGTEEETWKKLIADVEIGNVNDVEGYIFPEYADQLLQATKSPENNLEIMVLWDVNAIVDELCNTLASPNSRVTYLKLYASLADEKINKLLAFIADGNTKVTTLVIGRYQRWMKDSLIALIRNTKSTVTDLQMDDLVSLELGVSLKEALTFPFCKILSVCIGSKLDKELNTFMDEFEDNKAKQYSKLDMEFNAFTD